VAERQQLTAEMMSTNAGLHANQTRRHVGQARLDLSAAKLLAQDDGTTLIHIDQVEAVLANVDPQSSNVLKRSCGHSSDPHAGRPFMKGRP
jgi:hypothetical protein